MPRKSIETARLELEKNDPPIKLGQRYFVTDPKRGKVQSRIAIIAPYDKSLTNIGLDGGRWWIVEEQVSPTCKIAGAISRIEELNLRYVFTLDEGDDNA
jgi:hypothetical protein